MKNILVDVNILKKEKINDLINSGVLSNAHKTLKFYVSEILLKQRLAQVYHSKHKSDYDYYLAFLQKYFEPNLIDAAQNIVKREIESNFMDVDIFSEIQVKNIQSEKSAYNHLDMYDAKKDKDDKKKLRKDINIFLTEIKKEISELRSEQGWKDYCYKFVEKYNFATGILNTFLDNQEKYNRATFSELLSLWWEYSTIIGTYQVITPEKMNILKISDLSNIPKNSFLYNQIKIDKYIIDYCFIQNKAYDEDSPNDLIYIALMKDFDILLTDDESFMKECFEYIYKDTNKQILKLEQFISQYS